MGPFAGVFRGAVGDNEMHAHGAHQVSIGLDQLVTVHGARAPTRGRAVFIAASHRHRVCGSTVLSVYADVSSDLGIAMLAGSRAPVAVLSNEVAERLAAIGRAATELDAGVMGELARAFGDRSEKPRRDPVFTRTTRSLSDALRGGVHLSRADLAAQAGLSESRFSHWFRERAGMPMQTYRKWQRLALAVEQILDGDPMAAAAVHAGFADQAHFVRTFRAMFGINPAAGLGRARPV